MNLNDYQVEALNTSSLPQDRHLEYLAIGLGGETGEVLELIKRTMRGERVSRDRIKEELGDLLWYLSMVSKWHGIELDEIAEYNLLKIKDR